MKNIEVIVNEAEETEERILHHLSYREILKASTGSWMYLPEELLITIFEYLSFRDLGSVAQTCCRWKTLADMEFLWKKRLLTDFHLKPDTTLHPGAKYWKQEYERLSDRVPCIELDKIMEHKDEVLHVAFSHNGMMFCTCSKDAYVKVFNADWPFNTVFSSNLGGPNSILHWKYSQLSQFSPCDTQLLVSGRCSGSEQGGEIVIYNIYAGNFTIQSRVRINPFDIMGAWLNESHILSARAHWVDRNRQCLFEVILNKSAQEIENLHQSTVTRTFLFRSNNFFTLSCLQVADLAKPMKQMVKKHYNNDLKDLLHEMHCKHLQKEESCPRGNLNVSEDDQKGKDHLCQGCDEKLFSERRVKRFKRSSPVRYSESTTTCFSFCMKGKRRDDDVGSAARSVPNLLLKSCGLFSTDTDSIADMIDFPQTTSPASSHSSEPKSTSVNKLTCATCGKVIPSRHDDSLTSEVDSSSAATSADEDFNHVTLPDRYKLLICFTGSLVREPHQVGFKIVKQEECNKVVDQSISHLLHTEDHSRPEVDTWDHKIELNGQGIGMTISPCNRYLYVNVRSWVRNRADPLFELSPFTLSDKIGVFVYDLLTMKQVSTLSGHNVMRDTFFLHLSSNDLYVASGSEDTRGYMWDRHYGTPVATFPHDDVVNCVAVNPRDPSMAVSVSDDRSIKIWRSKSFHRLLKGARPKARIKFRTHVQHLHKS